MSAGPTTTMTLSMRILQLKATQRLPILAVAFCVLGWTIQQTLSVTDPPDSNAISSHEEATTSEPAKVTPPAVGQQDPQAVMRADPLFHAILQQFKEGRENLSTEGLTSQPKTDAPSSDSITPEQWQAVELILRAARILENEEKRFATGTDASKSRRGLQAAIQLRALALQIIQIALKP